MDHTAIACPFSAGMAHMNAKDCPFVMAANCKLLNLNSPITAYLDYSVATPVLLTTLPVSIALSDTGRHARQDFLTPGVPASPLHILHLTLII